MLTVTVTENVSFTVNNGDWKKQLRILNSWTDEVEASPKTQFIIHSSGDELSLRKLFNIWFFTTIPQIYERQ